MHDEKVHVVSVGCFTRFPTFLCSGELIEQQITTISTFNKCFGRFCV